MSSVSLYGHISEKKMKCQQAAEVNRNIEQFKVYGIPI